jgi:hypothetical protein
MAVEIKPTRCEIESSLDSLADAFNLALVEEDSAAPLSPTAQAWRTLTRGSLVRLRLGLRNLGLMDYGTFRVDSTALEPSADSWTSRIRGRDRAAELIDNLGLEIGEPAWAGAGEFDPLPPEGPPWSARRIIQRICTALGLGLVWDAPDYAPRLRPPSTGEVALGVSVVTPFGIFELQASPDADIAVKSLEIPGSCSKVIGSALDPLQQAKRHRTDAWIADDTLFVRRRGNGPTKGTIDCALGQVRSIERHMEPLVGEITVRMTIYEAVETPGAVEMKQGDEGSTSGIRQVEDVVDGEVVARESETMSMAPVGGGDGSPGTLVAAESTSTEERDVQTDDPKVAQKHVSFQNDDNFFMASMEEQTIAQTEEGPKPVSARLVRQEQITPRETRTTAVEVGYDWDGNPYVRAGYPRWEQSPGKLPDPTKMRPKAKDRGDFDPHEFTEEFTFHLPTMHLEQRVVIGGTSNGGGTTPRDYQNDEITGRRLCQQIADDLSAESGKWVYNVTLTWPRPLLYRKGDKVTLTNLPGGCPDLVDAIITAVRTRYSEPDALWTHQIEVEAWRDD